MSFEIERKFLLRSNDWRPLVTDRIAIRQAYLSRGGKASVRVRIKDNSSATLTIKSEVSNLRRLELEYPIPVVDAELLFPLREGATVEKIRHVVPWQGLKWEIDVFESENAGLVTAEIELRHETQTFDLPAWIGEEVTRQPEYYNSALARRPYRTWTAPVRQVAR